MCKIFVYPFRRIINKTAIAVACLGATFALFTAFSIVLSDVNIAVTIGDSKFVMTSWWVWSVMIIGIIEYFLIHIEWPDQMFKTPKYSLILVPIANFFEVSYAIRGLRKNPNWFLQIGPWSSKTATWLEHNDPITIPLREDVLIAVNRITGKGFLHVGAATVFVVELLDEGTTHREIRMRIGTMDEPRQWTFATDQECVDFVHANGGWPNSALLLFGLHDALEKQRSGAAQKPALSAAM